MGIQWAMNWSLRKLQLLVKFEITIISQKAERNSAVCGDGDTSAGGGQYLRSGDGVLPPEEQIRLAGLFEETVDEYSSI